jgi:calcium permeable stress-gated cation channel
MITRELNYYITVRQAYLLSPQYANRISSRTVLVTTIPERYQHEAKLRQVFGRDVKNVWLCTDCSDLEDLVELRDKTAFALEGAETKLIKMATKNRFKAMKKGGSDASGAVDEEEAQAQNDESGSIASKWVAPKKRPTHKLKFLIGKKVDTINWSRENLPGMIEKVDAEQALHRAAKAKILSSAFIEFTSQSAAQTAVQSVAHHQPLHMAPRYIGVRPEEVIWSNLKLKWWERLVKNVLVIAAITATVIFWSIPVAFVGSISNINALIDKLPWLGFILDIPTVVLGVVTGLLPSVLLSILMALLPIYLRSLSPSLLCAKFANLHSDGQGVWCSIRLSGRVTCTK